MGIRDATLQSKLWLFRKYDYHLDIFNSKHTKTVTLARHSQVFNLPNMIWISQLFKPIKLKQKTPNNAFKPFFKTIKKVLTFEKQERLMIKHNEEKTLYFDISSEEGEF